MVRSGVAVLVALIAVAACKDEDKARPLPRPAAADAAGTEAGKPREPDGSSPAVASLDRAVPGAWFSFEKEGRFHAAICALGPRPSIGSHDSPEHSATRDPSVARDVACPPPIPAIPPPARGGRAIALTTARTFAPTRPDDSDDGLLSAMGTAGELVTVDEPGPARSRVVRPDGTRIDIENVRLIELEPGVQARPGDVVLGLHPDADGGVVRGFVLKGGAPTTPRATRLGGFGNGLFGEFELAAGTFRVIGADLDPGSLVAIPLADRVEIAMVLKVAGSLIVTIDQDRRLRALHRSSAVAMPVASRPTKGNQIFARFAANLAAGKIVQIDAAAGHVGVIWESFPDGEIAWIGAGGYIDRDLSLGIYRTIDLSDP